MFIEGEIHSKYLELALDDDGGVKWATDLDNLLLCARDHIGKDPWIHFSLRLLSRWSVPTDVILLANWPQGPKPAPS